MVLKATEDIHPVYTLQAALLSTGTWYSVLRLKNAFVGFLGGPGVKNLPARARDTGSVACPVKPHTLWSS